MTKLQELYEKVEQQIVGHEFKQLFRELIAEIEGLKKPQADNKQEEEEWLTPEEFSERYTYTDDKGEKRAIFSPAYLSSLKTGYKNSEPPKFFKPMKYFFVYSPIETFRYIMSLPYSGPIIRNRLIKSNFFGLKL